MPRTIEEGFREFLGRLTPSGTETDAAKRHRKSISECLDRNFGLHAFFRSGSFGNGTSVSGYSDVDYFASLREIEADSSLMLALVETVLDTRFPETGVEEDAPAVMVPFGPYGMESTEVVPADYLYTEDEVFRVFDIADPDGGWMRASPDAHNAFVRNIDEDRARKVKPLIRFLKYWKYQAGAEISSFYLEIRTALYAEDQRAILYDWDVAALLEELRDDELASIEDPMGISGRVEACTSDAHHRNAMSELQKAAALARAACDAESDEDTYQAFELWDELFDGEFPSYYR